MTTLAPLPDWNAENWRDWQKMGLENGYHWHQFIPFSNHPMASPLARETRVGTEPISQLDMRELSYLWAKDVVDRSIGSERLRELAGNVMESYDSHEQDFQDLQAGVEEGLAILSFTGAKSVDYPIQLSHDDVALLRLLLAQKGVLMGEIELDFLAEAHVTLNNWVYYLARGQFPYHVPVSYLIQSDALLFIGELSLLESYKLPDIRLLHYLAAKEYGFHPFEQGFHVESRLEPVVRRAVESGACSLYHLRLMQEPHINLAHALYDYHLWSCYGQTRDPESEKDTFDSMISNTDIMNSLDVPENRARLFGLYGTMFPPL